jgi:predicted glycoside hydrolase/deacetylase ChbG (UPF0249 family)
MQTQRHLIINADGFGFTPGVNKGIIETFEFGLVKSTSCTPNFGHLGDASRVQAKYPHVSFGIHFNLNVGFPCAPCKSIPSLIGEDGRFLGESLIPRLLSGKVKSSEVETELTAQAGMLADQGVRISHWDGHQNKHLWPGYFGAALRVSKKFGIKAIRSHRRLLYTNEGKLLTSERLKYYIRNPVRFLTHTGGRLRTLQAERRMLAAADYLVTPGYADGSHKSFGGFWRRLAETLPPGVFEVYCHPGYPDQLLRENSKYVEPRRNEVEALTSQDLRCAFESCGIKLISFWDLQNLRGTQK